jgi:hypothetical protein
VNPGTICVVKSLSPRRHDDPETQEGLVTVPESVRLAPGATRVLLGKLKGPKRRGGTPLVYIEPAKLQYDGIRVAQGVSCCVMPTQKQGQPYGQTASSARPADRKDVSKAAVRFD